MSIDQSSPRALDSRHWNPIQNRLLVSQTSYINTDIDININHLLSALLELFIFLHISFRYCSVSLLF